MPHNSKGGRNAYLFSKLSHFFFLSPISQSPYPFTFHSFDIFSISFSLSLAFASLFILILFTFINFYSSYIVSALFTFFPFPYFIFLCFRPCNYWLLLFPFQRVPPPPPSGAFPFPLTLQLDPGFMSLQMECCLKWILCTVVRVFLGNMIFPQFPPTGKLLV